MKPLLILLALGLLLTQSSAHDAKRPEFNTWYKSLRNPKIKSAVVQDMGCCGVRDCHETDAEMRGNRWWARVGEPHVDNELVGTVSWTLTEWRPVPDYAVLQLANPTGTPVICHSQMYEIWCFVPDNQY